MVMLLLEIGGGMKDIPDVNKRTPICKANVRKNQKIIDMMTKPKNVLSEMYVQRTNCGKCCGIWKKRNQHVQQFPFQGKCEIEKDMS